MKWDNELDELMTNMRAASDTAYRLGIMAGIAGTVLVLLAMGLLGYACLRWWGLL